MWMPGTTVAEVAKWGSVVFPVFLLSFVRAERDQNAQGMTDNIRLMRGVVTKLDQFRRVKVREWEKATESNRNTESVPQ